MQAHVVENCGDLLRTLRAWSTGVCRSGLPESSPTVYFRGVRNSSHELLSTLERNGVSGMLSLDYYSFILDMKPEIERIAGCTWKIPSLDEYRSFYSCGSPFMLRRGCYSPAVFDYMAWLRHYGFASPLLDWTHSLDVAMFFAFRGAGSCAGAASGDMVGIYAMAYDSMLRYEAFGEPSVFVVDREARANNRYSAQRAACSVSVVGSREADNVCWRYRRHQDGLDGSGQQDVLAQFCIPASERDSVLSHLDRVGVNESSLFGSSGDNDASAGATERIEIMAREFNSQLASIRVTNS